MKNLLEKRKFKSFRERLGYNQTAFAEKLNIATGSVGMIESETEKNLNRTVTANIKIKIKEVFNIDFDSDVDNEGNIINTKKKSSNIISIPFYPVKAAAGEGVNVPEYAEKDVIHFDKRWLQAVVGHNPEHLSLIIAEGDSMLPDIQDGDLLMVDDSIREVIPNKTFVIKQDDKYRVKKLKTELNGDIQIISNNPNYKTETMDRETEIIGQVIWNGSKESV